MRLVVRSWRAAVAAAALIATVICACAGPAAASTPVIVRTRVDLRERGVAVARSFLGFSSDWYLTPSRVGTPMSGPDPIYDRLLSYLTAAGDGAPTLRVGGSVQDQAWWNPFGQLQPANLGIRIDITPAGLQSLAMNASVTGQRMILGLNLAANEPALAQDEARAMLQYIPRHSIIAFDIGNDPDDYASTVRYQQHVGGRVVDHFIRPRSWNGSAYLHEFDRFAAAIARVAPGLPLSGTSGYGAVITPRRFLAHEHRRVALYTARSYPFSSCATRNSPSYPTFAHLLGPSGIYTTLAATLAAVVAARTYHLPVRLDEFNSDACDGTPTTTGAFGAALWELDQFLLDAAVGVQGVNLTLDSGRQAPFIIGYQGGGWSALVGPLYYGMLLFADGVGNGARILAYPLTHARTARGVNARVWALRARAGGFRFIAVNKDTRRSGYVEVAVPHSTAAAMLVRLLAPSYRSFTHVTLAGQSIAIPTTDGALLGARAQQTVRPRHGTYRFYLPKTSAALLSVPG